jgi:hypothetical protein
MLDKLDWWIKCLEEEGIYVWLDLHVGRRIKAADGVEGFAEISQGKSSASLTGYNFVNPSIQDIMKQFDEQYLNHQNRFTRLRYKDDPAIVALLITNENDLTNHFGNALLPNQHVPQHTAIYLREAEIFAAKFSLPKSEVWRSWENGPAKIFLNDLERRFDVDMIGYLRNLGVKSPIITTSTWGMNPLSSLPALTSGDIVDVHSYGSSGELQKNPLTGATLAHWIAAAHVVGKPLTATEWGMDDHGAPSPDRQNIPLYVSASGSLQGLRAAMFYAYSYEPLTEGGGTASPYQAYNDPALLASLPAAALLFRRSHVKEANTAYVFVPTKEMLFDRGVSAANSVALRTASERGKLLIALPQVSELPWLEKGIAPTGVNIMNDPNQAQVPTDAKEIVSDTGELKRNWNQGTFTVDTPMTQAAVGRIGGKSINLGDVAINIVTPNSVVAVQSLDEKPIRQSQRIVISLGAQTEGTISITASPGMNAQARGVQASYARGRYLLRLDRNLYNRWIVLAAPHKNSAYHN